MVFMVVSYLAPGNPEGRLDMMEEVVMLKLVQLVLHVKMRIIMDCIVACPIVKENHVGKQDMMEGRVGYQPVRAVQVAKIQIMMVFMAVCSLVLGRPVDRLDLMGAVAMAIVVV